MYLSHLVENVKDLLKWWFDNRQTYPNLSRMAEDYLSIPGKLLTLSKIITNSLFTATSTAVERVFSQGRHLLHFMHNHLKPHTICTHLCLSSWGHQNMLQWKDVHQAVRFKKQKRGYSVPPDEVEEGVSSPSG